MDYLRNKIIPGRCLLGYPTNANTTSLATHYLQNKRLQRWLKKQKECQRKLQLFKITSDYINRKDQLNHLYLVRLQWQQEWCCIRKMMSWTLSWQHAMGVKWNSHPNRPLQSIYVLWYTHSCSNEVYKLMYTWMCSSGLWSFELIHWQGWSSRSRNGMFVQHEHHHCFCSKHQYPPSPFEFHVQAFWSEKRKCMWCRWLPEYVSSPVPNRMGNLSISLGLP